MSTADNFPESPVYPVEESIAYREAAQGMGGCDFPDGCDAPATVHVERPEHWHDDAFCAEHAPTR